jgi:hypothetical protein
VTTSVIRSRLHSGLPRCTAMRASDTDENS